MSVGPPNDTELAARARAWRRCALEAICDVVEPWQFGVVARSDRYPSYYEFNVVQVRERPTHDVDALIEFTDQALSGLGHRRIDFEQAESAAAMRGEFEQRRWRSTRLLHMWHKGEKPRDPATVEEVPFDAVHQLRMDWHEEDFPGVDATEFFGLAREVSLARGARVLAVMEAGVPMAYAQIESVDDAAEIRDVYVHKDRRGHGLGTAVTSAAIRAAPPVRDLWITADDEDRPKHLYTRLGFRPVTQELQFLRLP